MDAAHCRAADVFRPENDSEIRFDCVLAPSTIVKLYSNVDSRGVMQRPALDGGLNGRPSVLRQRRPFPSKFPPPFAVLRVSSVPYAMSVQLPQMSKESESVTERRGHVERPAGLAQHVALHRAWTTPYPCTFLLNSSDRDLQAHLILHSLESASSYS